ncbi:6-phosphogluconolactonase [Candidatus Peregrinibacteria bacterium]|nr:6-phosphogluconolactonase [Candidatus Peregrinibacteria bacterium]
MIIKIFRKEKNFEKETIKFIKKIYKNKESSFSVALSGGTTPEKIYNLLSKENLPFNKTDFFEVDERYAPLSNKDTNHKMIYSSLIKTISPKAFHYFDTSLSIKKSLEKYANELSEKPLDLTILGIGEDGHTASLFPYSKTLKEKKYTVAHTQTDRFKIKDRLTLTFPKILQSKKILVLIKNKNSVLKELKTPRKTFTEFPALKLIKHKDITIHALT